MNTNSKIITRNSKKREMILQIITDEKKLISAEEIYNRLQKLNSNINLSTVYRALTYFSDNNMVTKQISSTGTYLYEINDHMHKHKIICDICNDSKVITDCPIDNLQRDISTDTGFKITSHLIELHGICSDCQKLKTSK